MRSPIGDMASGLTGTSGVRTRRKRRLPTCTWTGWSTSPSVGTCFGGYQFKSVAALGPIFGPFIGIRFGGLPALLWFIGGNFFIGCLQDYGPWMVSFGKGAGL